MSDVKSNNSGDYNSRNYNSGDYNSRNYNSGDYNSGNYNSGDYNSGDYNSRNYNSGDYNSGNYNSGYSNSGYRNSGNYNSGSFNSGNFNSGNYNSGYFNTNTPTVRMFNKDTNLSIKEINMPYIDLVLNRWVEDAVNYPNTGGYLKTYTYKEAWANAWNCATEDVKQMFKDLPNFCPKIFKEITGIDVTSKVKIEVDGRVVYISKESAIALNLIKE